MHVAAGVECHVSQLADGRMHQQHRTSAQTIVGVSLLNICARNAYAFKQKGRQGAALTQYYCRLPARSNVYARAELMVRLVQYSTHKAKRAAT